jgi:hypothetical protein
VIGSERDDGKLSVQIKFYEFQVFKVAIVKTFQNILLFAFSYYQAI